MNSTPDSLLIIALSLVVAIPVIALMLRSVRVRKLKQRQQLGITWLVSMAELLSHVQQHRGLTNGFLKGGEALAKQIPPLQLNIKRDLSNIESAGAWVVGYERWLGIVDHLSRLTTTYGKKDSTANLAEHNALIQNILFLIDDMAQAHDLLLVDGLQLVWREMLATTEFIGQARAIGTGLSAEGYCDSVSRIRLNYLCEKILLQSRKLWEELSLDAAKRVPIDRLVRVIREKVAQERITISPAEFFEIATRAIDGLSDQYVKKIQQTHG